MRNKNKSFALLMLLIMDINSILVAQEGWFSINRITEGNDMNSIYFINDSVGLTVSNEGNLFMTTNNGEDWSCNKLSSSSLNDITFKDNIGFIVGDEGKIFKSSDGVNWEEKNSETYEKLNAVYFIDADTGYVFGNNSIILKTYDKGETWKQLQVYSDLIITDGAFSTPDFGLCTSSDGFLLRTSDYGETWQELLLSSTVDLYSVFFPNPDIAYITGWKSDGGLMLKLNDNGDVIHNLYPMESEYVCDINSNKINIVSSYFLNADTGYIVGDFGFISKTTDGGKTWNRQKNPNNKNLKSVFFLNENYGYACGEDSTILQTTDGGLHWNLHGSGHIIQLYDIFFPNEQVGYAVGDKGYFLKTTDGGTKWKILESNFDHSIEFVYFLNADTGFIGGYSGKVLKTTDGGNSWFIEDYFSQDVNTLRSINFYDQNTGIISAGNKMLKTDDAGNSWEVLDSQTETYDVAFLDENTIISVGVYGLIYKSTDGGYSWSKKYTNYYESFTSVTFLDDKIGYAVSSAGTILQTKDSGESWNKILSYTTERLWDIKFLSNTTGYIVGEGGIILFSQDAGQSWTIQNFYTHEDLTGIFFINQTTGYIVGHSGTMLKTINGGIVGVEEDIPIIPTEFYLYQNYPNPFNPVTSIKYALPQNSNVTIEVFSVLGEKVATLVNETKTTGYYETKFDASNLSSGIYIYRLTANSLESGEVFVKAAKMLMIK